MSDVIAGIVGVLIAIFIIALIFIAPLGVYIFIMWGSNLFGWGLTTAQAIFITIAFFLLSTRLYVKKD